MKNILENLIKIMLGINLIGFIYRLNCNLSLFVVHIYPLFSIIYKESYNIILICIILYFIVKMIQIHDEIIVIKNLIINNMNTR